MALLWVLTSYFLGAVPSAYIVARALKGIDIRQYGSGNVGGSNVRAHVSDAAFVMVGVADAAKGALAVAIGRSLGLDPWVVSASGAAAMAGHNWSLFIGGAGGRGIGTAFGALLILSPLLALALALSVVVGYVAGQGAILVLLAMFGLSVLAWVLELPGPVVGFSFAVFVLHALKRLLSHRPPWTLPAAERGRVLLYRLFLDRDTIDHESWVYRGRD